MIDHAKEKERLAELGNTTAVKSRLGGWQELAEKDTTVASATGLAHERTAELARTTSIKDRMASYNQVAAAEHKVDRAPVHIPLDPAELPTKDTQGQHK